MSNRIDQVFSQLRSDNKTAFVAYVAAGDPDMPRSLEVMLALERAGADIIELGVAFSDPLADGVVNQMAAQRALDAGATLAGTLDLVRDFRKTGSQTPIVFFTYLNPVYVYGFSRFHQEAAAAGVDGVLFLDLPPEESQWNAELKESNELCHIRLIAPTTPDERIQSITRSGEGFIYYVCREGVTGAKSDLADDIDEQVAGIQQHTQLPVVVGFGISTPDQALSVARSADGVVVGSAIVRCVEQYGDKEDLAKQVEAYVKPLVDAVKSV
ncbi:MAG: tryptophan synthase subunit alpha [Verrucomicrobiota bacterium]